MTECKLSITFKESKRLGSFKGKTQKGKTAETTNEKNAEKEKKAETAVGKNAERERERERGRARLKRRIRTNSGAILMSEVEASLITEL